MVSVYITRKNDPKCVVLIHYALVFTNNHTTVWGSYWSEGKWGYKCCRSYVKNSYCTGSAGIEAQKASQLLK